MPPTTRINAICRSLERKSTRYIALRSFSLRNFKKLFIEEETVKNQRPSSISIPVVHHIHTSVFYDIWPIFRLTLVFSGISSKSRRYPCVVFQNSKRDVKTGSKQFHRIAFSSTRGSFVKITYTTPRTSIRCNSFTCSAGSLFLSLESALDLISPLFSTFWRKFRRRLLSY